MKVLLVNTLYHPHVVGGADRSVRFLAEELVEQGNTVSVVCLAPEPEERNECLQGVKVYYLRLRNLYWPFGDNSRPKVLKSLWHLVDSYNPWMARDLGRVLDRENPDVVHTNNLTGFSAAVWQAVASRRLPLVHTLRDHSLLCSRSSMFTVRRAGSPLNCQEQCLRCRWLTRSRKMLSRHVHHVVGISRFLLERHCNTGYFAQAKKRSVIYNSFRAANRQDHATTLQARGAQGKLRLGYIGRLQPEKGVGRLLEIFDQERLGDDFSLAIAGAGPKRHVDGLKRQASNHAVEFLGTTTQDEFFSKIDILVVPSLCHEGLSRAVIEAYAYGVPVVGSRRGGIPEIIDVGHTGFVFDPETPGNLASMLRRFVKDPGLRDRMREALLLKAKDFSTDRIAGQYLSVYESVMGREKVQCEA